MKTWYLIADRGHARIVESRGRVTDLHVVEQIEHPEGRLQDREINSDRPGRAFDSAGQGRHAMSWSELPHERVAANFARELAHKVDAARKSHRFEKLVLVAEPRFLGLLREALPSETANLVARSIAKDLANIPERELSGYLQAE